MASRFALHVLGVPSFERDGQDLHLPSRRVLGLLASLAVDGRTTRARLASTLWSEAEDPVARRNLRRELARLREAGLGDVFEADLESVRLGPAVSVDVAQFEAACERADPVAALAVWRGPLLDGFALGGVAPAFDAWLTERRDSLARKWRKAAAEVATQREAAGDGRAALEWHLRLLAEDPLQELHHVSAMRLHHLLGERAAALAVFERCSRLLESELGLKPLASTTALADTIRATERVAPLVARAAGGEASSLDAPLVGRTGQVAALRERRAAVVLLQGEAGVGKTRLAQECLLARSTLSVRCEAVAQGAPLHAIGEALRAALERSSQRERLETLTAADRREAARLLPVLGPGAKFEQQPESGMVGRGRFFHAIGEVIDRLVGPGGTLWIDDLHWSDEASLALLAQLAHRYAEAPHAHAHIVAAARGEELELHAGTRDALLALERSRLLVRVPVLPLSDAETLELVRALAASAGGTLFSARLQRATRGNPYYLLETIRFLFDTGELQIDPIGGWVTRYDDATADYAELPVPPTLAATVIERVERLGPAARRILETGALAHAGFALSQVQPATALNDWDALEGLERAVRANFLMPVGQGYRFAHELARDALASQLGAERRRVIHHRLADVLIAQQAHADLIANHLQGAGRSTEALTWRVAAGRDAERIFAWSDALAQYAAALAIGTSPAEEIAIRRSRVAVLRTMRDPARLAAELDAIETLAGEAPDPALALELMARRVEVSVRRQHYPAAIELARRAWSHPAWPNAQPALRQRLICDGAFALEENGECEEARRIYERELGNADGHPPSFLGDLHYGRAAQHINQGEFAAGRQALLRSIDYFIAAKDDPQRLRSMNILAYCEFECGDRTTAIETLERLLDEAEPLNHVGLLVSALSNSIRYLVAIGEADRAQRNLDRVEALSRGVDDPVMRCRIQLHRCEIAFLRGELGAAVAAARRSIEAIESNRTPVPDVWPWFVLARLFWWIGDSAGAARLYHDLPQSPAWHPAAMPAVSFLSVAWLLPVAAEAATAVLAPTTAIDGVSVRPATLEHFKALALHRLGRHREALEILEPASATGTGDTLVNPEEERVALRLDVRAALGLDNAATVEAADGLMRSAAPLLGLRLGRSVASALRAAGETSRSDARDALDAALCRRLLTSLEDEPELRASLAARYGDVLAAPRAT